MKNILNIIRHDMKRLTASAVAMITIMGLCIIPCLYAWFNIFSNWDPYSQQSTGRIAVAVACEDQGVDMLGFKVNVGQKVVDALKGNNDIGWVFVDSTQDALNGVYASDYYAALVIPEDFSEGVLSFISGNPENPQMFYYENEKKNAIAPKITGKAKTAVIEQVNSTFVSTLAKYVSEAAKAADENGLNPQSVLNDLSGRLTNTSDRLNNSIVMLQSIQGLTSSSQKMLNVSEDFVGNVQKTIKAEQDLLGTASEDLPKTAEKTENKVSETIKTESEQISEELTQLQSDLDKAYSNIDTYNEFISKDLAAKQTIVNDLKTRATDRANALNRIGLTGLGGNYQNLANKLGDISSKLDTLQSADASSWAIWTDVHDKLSEDITQAKEFADRVGKDASAKIDGAIDDAIANARKALEDMSNSLDGTYGRLNNLNNTLNNYEKTLNKLDGGLGDTLKALQSMQTGLNSLAGLFDKIANNNAIENVNGIFADDSEVVAEYLKSPVKMDTEVLYPIREYGSAMAPFYTVLAQWIGGLLTAVLIKTKIKERDSLPNLKVYQRFFGRYATYLFVGLTTALIVSLGNLLYVDIYCPHPYKFVLAAIVNGIVFMMINFALVFALDNIGMGAAVIILVLQVAGAGGTYPLEVLPTIFQKLYPFMPFKYAMDAMRECIGGMYQNDYAYNLGMLGVFFLVAMVLGILLYKPALWLNKLIADSKAKSEVML